MANIFESMFSMLESKHDDKSKSKEKAEKPKSEPSSSQRTVRYDKPNLFENMLNNRDPDNTTSKGHKSAIDNFARNLSKMSFKKEIAIDRCSESDKCKSEISALKKSNDGHDSGDEDGSDLDDFMVVDEASSSDEDVGLDNDTKSGNILKEEATTSTPFVSNANKIPRKEEKIDFSASPITKSMQKTKSLELAASNQTVYSDVTSDESGEIHSDDNYLDLSDEENLFMKRVRLVKEPKVASTEVSYEELLAKELQLRKLKSKPMMNNSKVQNRMKKGGSRKPNMTQKEYIEKFIAEQRHVASTQQKIQDTSSTSNMDTDKLSSLRIEMVDGAKRRISIVNDNDTSSKLGDESTEKLNNPDAVNKSKEIDKSSRSGSTNTTNANSDNEDTHSSMSLDGLMVVDEAGCESSEHEDSEEEQFEVIDSYLDVDEEDEKVSSPQIDLEFESEKGPASKTNVQNQKDSSLQENVENKHDASPSGNSKDLEDEFYDSNDSFSNAMVIDEVTSPEVDNSAKESNVDSGHKITKENKISTDQEELYNYEENKDDIVQADNVASQEGKTDTDKSSTSIDLNDKSEKEGDKSDLQGTESCEIDNCATSMETDTQKQNPAEISIDDKSSITDNADVVDSSLNYNELDNDSESDDSKSLVIDESDMQPEDSSENEVDENINKPKKATDLVTSGCLSPANEWSKSSTLVPSMDVTEEVNKSSKPAIETADADSKNCESKSQTNFSPMKSSNNNKDTNSETRPSPIYQTQDSVERRPAATLDLTGKTKALSSRQSVHKVLTKRETLQRLYTTTVVRLDPALNKKVTKSKNTINPEKAEKSSETALQDLAQIKDIDRDLDNEPAQANRPIISTMSQPLVSSLENVFRTSATDKAPPSSKSESVVLSASGSAFMPSNAVLSVSDVTTLSSGSLTHAPASDITSTSLDTSTSSECGPMSCPTDNFKISMDSSVGDANSSSAKTSLLKACVESTPRPDPKLSSSRLSSPECERKDSSTMTLSENSLSNKTLEPPSNGTAVMSSISCSGLTTSFKNSSLSSTSTVKLSPDGRYTKIVSVSNVKSSAPNTLKQGQVIYVSPPGQARSENAVKIISAKTELPVTPVEKHMHSLISSPNIGPRPSPKSQPTSSVKYLITLKKCDKNGSEVDCQPETILTSDLVKSLTKIGTTSVVNCQKLVISPAKTIKVIPGQPKTSPSTPVVNIHIADPASNESNHTKNLSKSTNIVKEASSVLSPPPLIKRPNIYPQEQATDPSTATDSDLSSLLDVDFPRPIVMSSSLMQYHDITGIGASASSQKDYEKTADVQSDETPFKILKVSDSVLEGVSKKKKRVRKKIKDNQSNQYIYSYPVDYDKSQETIESHPKKIRKAPKRSKKRDPVTVKLTPGMTNRELYMPPKDKIDNFRGRFLVGKVNGAYICFKCKSKFSEVKYFRWHLWYHIHLHSDYCPTCDSQDPLGDCTTTDSLLQTVAGLENEQIFYVMTKGENANSFETYKTLSEVASDLYPSEKVNNQLLLSEAVTLSTRVDSQITNDSKYELDPHATTEELQPESVNMNNNAPVDNSANDETEEDNFMGLKILNTYSLSGIEGDFPSDSSAIESTQTQSLSNENLTSSTSMSANTLAVPNSNNLDTQTSRSASPITTDGICGSFYKCTFCDFSTLFPSEFKNHIYGNHMRTSIFKCYYCDFVSLGAGNYISHYGDHVNSVKDDCVFTCTFPDCEDKASRLEQHLKHLESHENWRPLCCQCLMAFPSLKSLSEHYKKNLVSLFSCQYCDAKAVDKKTYLHHVSQIHSLKARMVMVRKTLICNIKKQSNEISPTKQPPQSKFLSPTSDVCFSTFICQKCSFVSNDKSEFLNHKKIHSSVESNLELIPAFTCPKCPAAYNTLNNLWEHLQYHDEVIEFYIYKCPHDDFTTNDQEKGILHCRELHKDHDIYELVQQSVVMYKNSIHHCKLCGIKVKERNIFLRHLLIHGKDGEKVAQNLRSMADFDISACIKPTLAVKPSLIQPIKLSKSPKTPSPKKVSPKKVCPLTQQQRGIARHEPSLASSEMEEHQPTSEELLKLKTSLNKPVPVVSNPVNMVVQASPTYRYSAQMLDQKLKVLYTHKSGFFVCLICQSLFRVKNLLNNHIVEHLEVPYQCCKCGNQDTSYDAAISHALNSHNIEQINIIYSEAINDKITKMAQSLNSKTTNVSQTARDEFSKRVNILRQHKTFQSSTKTKSKVFTSTVPSSTDGSPNSKDAEELRMEMACRSMSAKESEKMSFLQEAETNVALMKLCKRGVESNWCRICSKPFSRSSLADMFIKEHILMTHLKYKPYKCQHCDFSAFSRKSFSVHCRTIHAGVFTFKDERNIGSLVDSYMKDENIVVEELSDDQEDADALDKDFGVEEPPTHFSKQPTTSSYVCEHCNTKFDCPFKLLRHKKLVHSKTSSNTARKSTTPAVETVRQLLRQSSETSCARKSTTKAANNRQQKSATQCARKSTAANRRQSLQETAVASVSNTLDVQKFVCQKCNFVTEKRKRAMIYHFKKHGFECFVECNNCQAKYTSMRLLLKHFELIHKGKELHPNYLPIESYFLPISKEEISALKGNRQQNASKAVPNVVKPTKTLPPFKCVFCDLEEIKEEFMRYHLYIHLDYKPFKCDQCTNAFSDPFQQKQHINGDHTEKAKSIFDKANIYETKVSEILIDCRRAVQKQQTCRLWDLEVVQNQLLEEFMNPVNWENNKEEEENMNVKEEEDIKPGEYIVTLASQSDSLITNNSFQSDGNISYDSDLPDLDVDIKPTIETTQSLADCVALKRKSKSSDRFSSTNKHPKIIDSKAGSKKKNLIESLFGVLGKEAKKKPKAAKRSLVSETESSASKRPRYSGEFDAEVILCYYCSFMSESITAVISHTHDAHLGGRRKNGAVGMLWVDTVTGGTYDFEGHIFSNGFDANITIDFPYMCGTCNYRSVELNDIYEHEQIQHLDLKSSTAFVIKKSLATSGGRGRSTVSYDETNRRKPNLTNSDKSKPATRKDKVPATVPRTTLSSKALSSLASSKTVLDASSSLDTPTASKNTDCKNSSSLRYRCFRCSTICDTEYKYRQHLATHKTFKCLVPDLARNPRLKCEICSYRAQDAVKFTKHMISHNGPAVMFLCGYCGFKAISTRAIKQHHHKRHENQSFDITKFVDKKSSYKNHSLIVDLEPQVKLENIMEMSQERFSGILNTSGNVSFES